MAQRRVSPPPPPRAYSDFVKKFPDLAAAWESIAAAGRKGPLSEREARLVKLAVAIGALREGSVHSSVRKAASAGINPDDIAQVIALAAGTLGMPATVAVHTWVREVLR